MPAYPSSHALVSTMETPPATNESQFREELEALAHALAHDVQAPLRIMLYCCGKLASASSLDPEQQEALQMLSAETQRMRALMQGVLDYIRMETFKPAFKPVESAELIAGAMETLEEDILRCSANITCAALPIVWGHRGRLQRLFLELIDNALKFRGQPPLKIAISAERKENTWLFCVEDNGQGMEEDYHEIIFGLFQRLHPQDAYPGHGLGLAMARKIVSTHGGRLWVESQPGVGSRFYFTLPFTGAGVVA